MPRGEYRPWGDAPSYREMCEALAEVRVPSYAALADASRAVRDDFHARWTRKMHARCGIDPTQPPKQVGGTRARVSNAWEARVARYNAIVAEAKAGDTAEVIGLRHGISAQHVRKTLRDAGIRVPNIKRYTRRAA